MSTDKIYLTQLPLKFFAAIFCFMLTNMAFTQEVTELSKEFINPMGSSFTNVVSVQANGVKTIYVSGQIGIHNNQMPKDFAEQADFAFKNIAAQLKDAGAGLSDIVKTTIYIVGLNPDKMRAFNVVRSKHLNFDNRPASTLIGVSSLVIPGMEVEIEATAVIEDREK